MSHDALALLEFDGVASGYACLDIMVKHSPITILEANLVEPGKFLILYTGGVAEVQEAHQRVIEEREERILSEMLLAFAHPKLIEGLQSTNFDRKKDYDCLGIVETKTISGALFALDRALKDTLVTLVGLRIAVSLGGKGFFVLEGVQHDIEAALELVESVVEEKGGLFQKEIIARPHPEAVEWLLRPAPFQLR